MSVVFSATDTTIFFTKKHQPIVNDEKLLIIDTNFTLIEINQYNIELFSEISS